MIPGSLRSFIAEQAHKTDENGTFPEKTFHQLATDGLLGITLPGASLDFRKGNTAGLLHLLRQIGSADLATGRMYEGHINALYLIYLYASAAQQARWYADVTEQNRLFGVWNTQAGNGVRIRDNGNDTFTLEGAKTFCSGAGFLQRPLITGALENGVKKGWQMCVIPVEAVEPIRQDASFWQPMGMKASVSYGMDFSGITLHPDDLLGLPDAYYAQPVFSGGAIRFAAVQLGGAQAILEAVIRYLKEMGRTEDPFQKARVAEMTWLVTSGNQWLDHAGNLTDRWLQEGGKSDEIVAYANMTRTAIEEICIRTMDLAGRSVGARGLMRPQPIERIVRDLNVYLRQPAPDASLTAIADFVCNPNHSAHDLWSQPAGSR